ncbi:hypothetical protein [Streptomyces regalis]|uniref:Uncharacterized protein n=1 Tax=Streptomyces regalis TaxID=68262 RepID=A0A117MJU5_9ACTN|nr:hypothetical protein ADL12_44890 [Streptomyces regalis]
MTTTDAVHHAVLRVSAAAWTPAVEQDGEIRGVAQGAEITGDDLRMGTLGPLHDVGHIRRADVTCGATCLLMVCVESGCAEHPESGGPGA